MKKNFTESLIWLSAPAKVPGLFVSDRNDRIEKEPFQIKFRISPLNTPPALFFSEK